ncbi:hypothetical protein [Okeania sp. SIO3B5]|uniref:hypothetical protein n=1 Tax=Okeania sp. SIO3B5 TaxID=2607811 RepID=UPI0025FEFD2B|nr:hypothetical protein [Okeania sp. SIO3B5]
MTFLIFFLPLVLYFFAAKIFNQIYIVLYFFLGKFSFNLRFNCLIFTKDIGILTNEIKEIKRSKIQYVQQVKTSGFKGNIFASWGLLIKTANREYNILSYQSYDKTKWLGNIIAAWAKVKYLPLSKESGVRSQKSGVRINQKNYKIGQQF